MSSWTTSVWALLVDCSRWTNALAPTTVLVTDSFMVSAELRWRRPATILWRSRCSRLRSVKVIKNDDSIRHPWFPINIHSNHRHISHRFRDKRRLRSKIARKSPIFPTRCVFNASAEGVPLGIRYRRRGHKKLEWWGYQRVEKVLR